MEDSVDLLAVGNNDVDMLETPDDEVNYFVEVLDGGTSFVHICKVCERKFDSKRGVTRHHTVMHVNNPKKRARTQESENTKEHEVEKEGGDDDDDEAKRTKKRDPPGLSKSLLDEWDEGEDENGIATSTQKNSNMAEILDCFGNESIVGNNDSTVDGTERNIERYESVGESFFNSTKENTSLDDTELPTIVNVDILVANGKIALLESKNAKQEQSIGELKHEVGILQKVNNDYVDENNTYNYNSLKEEVVVKSDLNNILQGKVSSLELQI